MDRLSILFRPGRFAPLVGLAIWLIAATGSAGMVTLFDFSQGRQGWEPTHQVANLRATGEGLTFNTTGLDPYLIGPAPANLPVDTRFFLTIRMKSTADGAGAIYFGRRGFEPGDFIPFNIEPDGAWREYTLLMPPMPAGTRLRLDPAGQVPGRVAVAWMKAEPIVPLPAARFERPTRTSVGSDALTLTSGEGDGALELAHDPGSATFVLRVGGRQMAVAPAGGQVGMLIDGQPRLVEMDFRDGAVSREGEALVARGEWVDPAGAHWHFSRTFRPVAGQGGAIALELTIRVSQDREIFHLPWLTMFPGLVVFGTSKTQAVLPGVEYLEDEPSSSEADFIARLADRRIVADHKLCFPLMAIVHEGRYVGLAWDRQIDPTAAGKPAAVFDSPDRLYHSGAHLMALWSPGVGDLRMENDPAAIKPFAVRAGETLRLRATLLGGAGRTVNEPVRAWLALRGGLPDQPEFEGGLDGAVELLARGWLDSDLHEDGTWRHAVWGDQFKPQPAADAVTYMEWLATRTPDAALAGRLRAAARRGLERLGADVFGPMVSHVHPPVPLLLQGDLQGMKGHLDRQADRALKRLAGFDAEGILRYRQTDPKKPDYGRTHYADHTAGHAALVLEQALEAATLTGHVELTHRALALLDRQTELYANTVPRGAQTWEIPLHTPDILASARLVRCYVLAHLLTGEAAWLEQARYWAWTGVSMIYLDPPTGKPVGLYATIAVLGATNWTAPNWVGLPVQWCGLVYRSALEDLARVDRVEGDFWRRLARGITMTGLQMTWPAGDRERQGLLPDFYHLNDQLSDGPAISPGTLQAGLAEAYGAGRIYDLVRLPSTPALLHAPGEVGELRREGDAVSLNLDAWPTGSYRVLVARVVAEPRVEWRPAEGDAHFQTHYDAGRQMLILELIGPGRLTLAGL